MCDYLCLFKPYCFLPLWLKITVIERPRAGTASQHAGGEVSFHICESAEVYLGLRDVPALFFSLFFLIMASMWTTLQQHQLHMCYITMTVRL